MKVPFYGHQRQYQSIKSERLPLGPGEPELEALERALP